MSAIIEMKNRDSDADKIAADLMARARIAQRTFADAGQARVDAILRRTIELARRIQSFGRSADQLELCCFLERNVFRHRLLSSIGNQLAILEPAVRPVDDDAAFNPALRRRDTPAGGRCTDQHDPRGGGGLA